MTKGFMATLLAASLAFTSISAVPARADSGELSRFLFGATTLFIIGSALNNNDRRYNGNNNRHVTRRNNHNNHNVYSKPNRKAARSACVRHNRYGQRYISQRCMSRYGY